MKRSIMTGGTSPPKRSTDTGEKPWAVLKKRSREREKKKKKKKGGDDQLGLKYVGPQGMMVAVRGQLAD